MQRAADAEWLRFPPSESHALYSRIDSNGLITVSVSGQWSIDSSIRLEAAGFRDSRPVRVPLFSTFFNSEGAELPRTMRTGGEAVCERTEGARRDHPTENVGSAEILLVVSRSG